MSDLLQQAAGTLRDVGSPDLRATDSTRRRVRASLVARRQRRRRLWMAVASLFVVGGVGSTAWAAVTGRSLTDWYAAESPAEARVPAKIGPASSEPRGEGRSTIEHTEPEPEPEGASAADDGVGAPPAEAHESERSSRRPGRRLRAARVPAPASAPVVSEAGVVTVQPVDEDNAAYELAHQLHFSGADPGRIVAAWDDYLASPGRRYAIEARFNRALALVRAGRLDEARTALEGLRGTYREADVNRLLEAL